jgi:hypothetical protein
MRADYITGPAPRAPAGPVSFAVLGEPFGAMIVRKKMNARTAGTLQGRIPVIVVLSALFVFVATNAISWVVLRHIPHINDEIGYLFQAKIFSLGRLYVPSPCGGSGFSFTHVINNGRWYSQYPPGFPLILLLGLAAGAPWIVNPLLATASILVFYRLGREMYGEKEGRLAAVLGALSPWFLLTSSTMLSHTASMLFFALFLLFLFKSLKAPTLLNGLVAGSSLGLAFLIRPYNVVAVSAPWVLYYGFRSLKRRQPAWRSLLGFGTMLLLAVACLMVYNQMTNGHPLRMGYIVKYGEDHGIGFGRAGFTGIPHTPGHGLYLTGENLAAINKYLFGWPLSSLIFLAAFVVPLKEERKKAAVDLLTVLSFLSLALALFIYWGNFVFIGARMYFEGLPLLLLMTVRGIHKTPALLRRPFPRLRPPVVNKSLAWGLGFSTLFAFVVTFPRWIAPPFTRSPNIYMAENFQDVTDRIQNTLARLPLGDSLVIMKFLFSRNMNFPDGHWGSGFLYNDPRLENRIIYAKDTGEARTDLLRCYPGRKAYLFVGTLDKGLLLPLRLQDNALQYGEPITYVPEDSRTIHLVAKPQDLFTVYAPAFRARLDALLAKLPPDALDGPKLWQLADEARAKGDFGAAAFFLEAALQIENEQSVRERLLGDLAFDYLKTGERADALEIMRKVQEEPPRFYDVLPPRGF